MKKLFLILLLVSFSSTIILNSCTKKEETNNTPGFTANTNDLNNLTTKSAYEGWPRVRVKLRHHGVPAGSSCTEPLGICIIINFLKLNHYPLTSGEITADWGTASLAIENDMLKVSFDQITDIGDGTIPIEEDFSVSKYVSDNFGFNDIIVKQGSYTVDYKNPKYPFGYAYFRIEIVK